MKQDTQIKQICNLIQTSCIPMNKKLNRENQIKFAYTYWNSFDEDITSFYEYLAYNKNEENDELATIIADFVNTQYPTAIKKLSKIIYNGNPEYVAKVCDQIKHNGNWLSLYNLDNEFEQASAFIHPIRYSYLLKSGQTFEIDKDKAQNIIGILTEENIPTAKCIVTSSFPYYAQDKIETYIQKIKTLK